MAHIDTLQVYKEYIQAGYTESQATAAVKTLNASFDGVATKNDLNHLENKVDLKLDALEKDLKYFFISFIVGSIHAPLAIGAVIWAFTR